MSLYAVTLPSIIAPWERCKGRLQPRDKITGDPNNGLVEGLVPTSDLDVTPELLIFDMMRGRLHQDALVAGSARF